MVKSFKDIAAEVKKKVNIDTLSSMTSFIKKKKISLWSLEKGRMFLKKQLILALFKDINAIGYKFLADETKNWNKLAAKSVNENTKRIRHALSEWAESYIVPGNRYDWNKASRNLKLGKEVQDTQLWIDSTDCPLKGRYSVSRKNPS